MMRKSLPSGATKLIKEPRDNNSTIAVLTAATAQIKESSPTSSRLRLLTVGGSDSGGGAGIQADLKTFAAFGAYGMSAITSLTAQNTCGVWAIQEVSASMVVAQIDAVLQDIGVDAIKIGMLANASIVGAVAERLRAYLQEHANANPSSMPPPIVVDPVMFAKGGASLLTDGAIDVMVAELLPLATVVTPNLRELECLAGFNVTSDEERRRAASAIAALGTAVLAKGGHMTVPGVEDPVMGKLDASEGRGLVVDLLLVAGQWHRFSHPRLETRSTHGAGCTLSSAIAVSLATGEDLPNAVRSSITYLHGAIAAADPLGRGRGPVDHLYLMQGQMSKKHRS